MNESDEILTRIRERGDSAFHRAALTPGMTFADVVSAVERALQIRLTIVPEVDTANWGTMTGFLAYFADQREGSIHVRASDAEVYSQFAASHELGHLLDDALCSGALHERSSTPPHAAVRLTTEAYEAELVAEHVAHRIARLLYSSPRAAESSW